MLKRLKKGCIAWILGSAANGCSSLQSPKAKSNSAISYIEGQCPEESAPIPISDGAVPKIAEASLSSKIGDNSEFPAFILATLSCLSRLPNTPAKFVDMLLAGIPF